jgi:hypothetical protein
MRNIVTVPKNGIVITITKNARDVIDMLVRMSGMHANKRKFRRRGISSYRGEIIVNAYW